jgi:hypothetical protein
MIDVAGALRGNALLGCGALPGGTAQGDCVLLRGRSLFSPGLRLRRSRCGLNGFSRLIRRTGVCVAYGTDHVREIGKSRRIFSESDP